MLASILHGLVPGALCVALCAAAFGAHAQTPSAGSRPDPLDARAAVPAVRYDSTLNRARRGSAEPTSIPWREANDTAARIGGWRTYAREAQQADPQPPQQPDPRPSAEPPRPQSDKTKPAASGHGTHKSP